MLFLELRVATSCPDKNLGKGGKTFPMFYSRSPYTSDSIICLILLGTKTGMLNCGHYEVMCYYGDFKLKLLKNRKS